MALKLIKPRHHADTPGHNRRGLLSTFCDPRPLKLRKLDPRLLKISKWTLSELTKVFPFNATDIVHVNFLIEIAAKDLLDTNANERFYSHLFLLHTIVPVLQPNSCLPNKTVSQVNSTNTTDNTDNG